MRTTGRALVMCAVVVSLVCGTVSLWTEAAKPPKNPCGCPLTYTPVWCDGGARYNNMCLAECDHATGCVEIPILPPS